MKPLRAAAHISCLLLISLAMRPDLRAGEATDAPLKTQFRRPVALALNIAGTRLYIAHRDSGTVSVLDTATETVIHEIPVGKRLSDLAILPGERGLLVSDERTGSLLRLNTVGDRLQVTQKISLSDDLVRLAVNRAGTRCYVGSRWARNIAFVDVGETGSLQKTASIELPFEPGEILLWEPAGKLFVAAAFGGRLAAIDVDTASVAAVCEIAGHNLRGLAVDSAGESLWIAHQQLNRWGSTGLDNIHWGILIKNVLQRIPLSQLLEDSAQPAINGNVFPLGDVGNGAADPDAIVPLPGDTFAVALAGTGEVAVLNTRGTTLRRLKTGARPTALVADPHSGRLYVANTLADSISLIDLNPQPAVRTISCGPTPPPSPQVRGELLFFDGRLSHDNWLSCHSCHTDGHTCGQMADTLGDGTHGTPKRVPTLLGVSQTDLWAWNGSVKELHDQIDQSIRKTMHGRRPTGREVIDIAAYLHTLDPPPPLKPQATDETDLAQLARGRALFHELNCIECHVPPVTYTTGGAFDVGLSDEAGLRRYNPPSLRGVGRREGLFHDQRAESLDAVFREHLHQLPRGLDDQELADLIRFLQSL